jgi:hypothetical protein
LGVENQRRGRNSTLSRRLRTCQRRHDWAPRREEPKARVALIHRVASQTSTPTASHQSAGCPSGEYAFCRLHAGRARLLLSPLWIQWRRAQKAVSWCQLRQVAHRAGMQPTQALLVHFIIRHSRSTMAIRSVAAGSKSWHANWYNALVTKLVADVYIDHWEANDNRMALVFWSLARESRHALAASCLWHRELRRNRVGAGTGPQFQ